MISKNRVLSFIMFLFLTLSFNVGCSTAIQKEESVYINTVALIINDYTVNVDLGNTGVWYDVRSLSSDAPNRFQIDNIPEGYIVNVNGIKLENGIVSNIDIESMSKTIGIPVTVQDMHRNKEITVYIRTLNFDLPDYDYFVSDEVEEGVYYYVIDSKWLVKWHNKKKEYVFFKNVDFKCTDFKRTEIDGKVYYSYASDDLKEEKPTYKTTIGYGYRYIYIMNENYEVIDVVKYMSNEGKLEGSWYPESHEHLILGEKHYLIMSYIPAHVTNIPAHVPHSEFGSRVLDTYIQEIKDGKLIWEWNSTSYPELYELSIENNDFHNEKLQWSDYVHLNSIDINPVDGGIICSARNMNTIFKINKETKDIDWILGGRGDEFGLSEEQKFRRQHFARYTEGGYITLFDNQTSWVASGFPYNEEDADVGNGIPRVIRLKIDEQNYKLLEYNEFTLGVPTAEFMSSATLLDLESDTYIIGWGGSLKQPTNALFSEVDFNKKKILCEVIPTTITDTLNYRVYKFDK